MRFRNLSGLAIPKDLWRALAVSMRIGGPLPGALKDDIGIYGTCKSLRVTVRPTRQVQPGKSTVSGSHTYGHISIAPCCVCTIGALTHVYLHELFHAWLFQHARRLYEVWDHCRQAERFADAGFKALGGAFRDRQRCGSYRLDLRRARRHLHEFRVVAESLTDRRGQDIATWRPRPDKPSTSERADA